MDGLAVFSVANSHPLAFLLSRNVRHVFACVRDTERGFWMSYDWHQGVPHLKVEAAADFDLEAHYRDHGYIVVPVEIADTPTYGPWQWNNCVGHAKTVLAIRSWAVTPFGLLKHLEKRDVLFAQAHRRPWVRRLARRSGPASASASSS